MNKSILNLGYKYLPALTSTLCDENSYLSTIYFSNNFVS